MKELSNVPQISVRPPDLRNNTAHPLSFYPHAVSRFACLREAASAKAGHAGAAFRPTITHGSALSAVFFQENFVSNLSAISMPIDLDRSNHVIVKRITNKVMLRGIEKRRIVDDREDRQSFVKRLGDLPEETETRMPRVRSEMAGRLIKELGMSLAEVARLLGVSTSAISKILHRIAQEGSE